jgi:predicted transcriptional regulator
MKSRDRLEIMRLILDVSSDTGRTRTEIMYRVMMSYSQLQEYYLPMLIQNGLLDYEPRDKKFKTTQKGMKYSEMIKNVHLALPSNP